MNAPTNPFESLPERFQTREAEAFLALHHALGRNFVDTVLLCWLVGEQGASPEKWISFSYRALAEQSQGAFAYRVVPKSLARLCKSGCLEQVDNRVRVNLSCVAGLVQVKPPVNSHTLNPRWVLWLLPSLRRWVDAAVLALLAKHGATTKTMSISLAQIHARIGGRCCLRGILKSLARLAAAGLLTRGRPGSGDLYGLQLTPEFPALLAQESAAWTAAGQPAEVWMPGLRIALDFVQSA